MKGQSKSQTKGRGGFSLIELLVAMVLLSFAMMLLFRGVEAVSETLVRGRRQSQMNRGLNQSLRILQEDLEQIVFLPHPFPALSLDLEDTASGRISFARLRQEAAPESDLEYVEYRIGAHPDISGLHRLTRAAAPLLDWESPPDLSDSGEIEILVDELIGLQVYTREEDGEPVLARLHNWNIPHPASLEIVLGLTQAPLPPVSQPDPSFLLRLQQFEGVWGQIRIVPRMRVRP